MEDATRQVNASARTQNARIWTVRVFIGSTPMAAPNGGSARVLLELLDHSV
jgi:hypothetical protein